MVCVDIQPGQTISATTIIITIITIRMHSRKPRPCIGRRAPENPHALLPFVGFVSIPFLSAAV